MDISDVESLLGITIPTDEKSQLMYEARLVAAIDQAKAYCNNNFIVVTENADGTTTENEVIPAGAQMGIALLVKSMGENTNVASQSLGDMSKSFFQGGTRSEAVTFLKPYRKASFK